MARPRLSHPNFRLRRYPSGNFAVTWTEAGRTRRLSTRTGDAAQAAAFLARFIAGFESSPPPPGPTLAQILDAYACDRVADGVAAPATLRNSCQQIALILGGIEPWHLSQATVRRYARERQAGGRRPATVIRELGTLRAALHWAVREHWIERAPAFRMPVAAPAARDRWLTKGEAGRLIEACTAPHLRLFVLLALTTAARRQAIAELTWDRVDLKEGLIDYGPGRGRKRRAIVPITDRLAEALDEARSVATTEHVVEFRARPAGNLKKSFAAACARAGLTGVTPHTLRHTAATWMVIDGGSLGGSRPLPGHHQGHGGGGLRQALARLSASGGQGPAFLNRRHKNPGTERKRTTSSRYQRTRISAAFTLAICLGKGGVEGSIPSGGTSIFNNLATDATFRF